jgi:hypothetical protein
MTASFSRRIGHLFGAAPAANRINTNIHNAGSDNKISEVFSIHFPARKWARVFAPPFASAHN